MRVIAIDPGKLCGWAAADIDPEGEWANVQHGILGAREMSLFLASQQGVMLTGDPEPIYGLIVVESWRLYRDHADEYVGSDMPYSKSIGQYELIGWLSDTPVTFSEPHRKKFALRQMAAFRPELANYVEDNMKRAHEDAHDMDAIIHLWAWTVDNRNVRKHT